MTFAAAVAVARCGGGKEFAPWWYFTVLLDGDSVTVGREIEAQDAVDRDEYLHATFPDETYSIGRAILVKIDGRFSYEHMCDERGILTRTVVERAPQERPRSREAPQILPEPR